MTLQPSHIRYLRSQIYAARRELERKLDLLDKDLLKLQNECQHPNHKQWQLSCPDCDKEFLEVETKGG